MKSAVLCASVVLLSQTITTQAQSASTVIDRYIKAIGGKEAVEKIVSSELSGKVSSADGRSGVFTQRTKRPHLFSVSVSWGDSRWRTGFNGRAAWQDDSVEGLRTLYGAEASRVRVEASYANTHFLMSGKVSQVSVTGRDQVRGRPVVVVVALMPDGTKRILFFDAGSHLLVKDEQQTDTGVEERFYDDYRPVDQVMEPHQIEWRRNGEVLRVALERVTRNGPLDERAFDVPSLPTDPPLDIDATLSAAARSEHGAAPLRESYAYTMTSTSGRVDPQGRITQEEGPSWEFFHLGGRPVARLVRNRGGQALSDAERRREDERVNNLVREHERQRASGQAERRRPAEPAPGSFVLRTPLVSADWFPVYVRMSAFSNLRRERLRDRVVVVVEFQPKPAVASSGDFERQAGVMAGTLWIDEASQHVIRIESHFCDDYDRVIQGSSIRAERILVNDEVWLPFRDETNHRWSFAFGNLSQWLITSRYSDHKRFSVATDSTVALPEPSPR